jgi:tripartite-type tricarboxylate transporter receptor subunit TctC
MRNKNSARISRRNLLRTAGLAMGAVATGLGLEQVSAAGYPERPIKLIVPFAPGGPTDIMARILGTYLGDALGGTVVVENRAGGGGNIGIGVAAHAEPDGYTLLITSSAYVVNPGLYVKIPYDPYTDFAAIAELGTSPNVILADPNLGLNSIADLVNRAKAHPNELNYASPGLGTTPHLSVELGYTDFVSDTFQGFLAPARTPPSIIELLSAKSIGVLNTPRIAEQLRNDGFEVLANGPDGMRKRIELEVPKWRDVINKAGIKPV